MSSTYPPYGGIPGRPCARCGIPLPPNEIYCGNCGYQNMVMPGEGAVPPGAAPSAPWGGSAPQTAYGGQYENQGWGQPQAPPPAPSAPAGGPYGPLIAPPFGLPSQGAGRGIYSNPNNMYGNVAQPGNAGNYYDTGVGPQSPYAAPMPPAMPGAFQAGNFAGISPVGVRQPSAPPRNSRMRVIVVMIALLIVVVGAGVGGYVWITARSGANSNTSSVTIPTPSSKVVALFSDAFTSNTNGWDLQGVTGKFTVTLNNGALALEDDDNKLLWELVPGNRTFGDFKLFVDATLSKGVQNNGYGIFIRGSSNQNTDLATYYRFELYGDGTYAIFKGVVDSTGNSSATKLVDYTQNAALQTQGKVNHIQIVAKGSSMAFMVNGQTLSTINDSSYTTGSVALFVSNLQGSPPGAQATFTHFAIDPPQA